MVFLHRKTNFFFTLPVIFCDVFEVIQKILEEFIFIDLKQVWSRRCSKNELLLLNCQAHIFLSYFHIVSIEL